MREKRREKDRYMTRQREREKEKVILNGRMDETG